MPLQHTHRGDYKWESGRLTVIEKNDFYIENFFCLMPASGVLLKVDHLKG